MLSSLLKKKLDADRLANVFVNAIIEATETSFDDISGFINEDVAFVTNPGVDQNYSDQFLLIVVCGNLKFIDERFSSSEAAEIRKKIILKLAAVYEMDAGELEKVISDYSSFISRVNHPSKNTLYGMSKAVFHKFKLNEHQESYFKSMKTPNPLFLKRMDDLMTNFLWDWDEFFKKYRMNLN